MAKFEAKSAGLSPMMPASIESEPPAQIVESDKPAQLEAEIKELEARLVALKAPPKIEFPKWVYHGDHRDGKLVNSQEEFDALDEGWGEKEDADAAKKEKMGV